jgi:DNA-binding transcriptional LysR family regulator
MTGPVKTFDLDAVQTFVLLASLANFTRVAEATGTSQSAVSLKLKRLETFLGRRLVERTPRSVRLTAEGEAFLAHARNLLAANESALAFTPTEQYRLRIGISDHAVGAELPEMLARLYAADPLLGVEIHVGFSRQLLDAFDRAEFDGVVVRRERSRRGGETLMHDGYAWMAAPSFHWRPGTPLPLANLGPLCGVRALAIRSLEAAGIPWRETLVGGGVAAIAAAASAGFAVAALARRVAPTACIEVGEKFKLPPLPRTAVLLYSRVSDARGRAAFRVMSAVFRALAAS